LYGGKNYIPDGEQASHELRWEKVASCVASDRAANCSGQNPKSKDHSSNHVGEATQLYFGHSGTNLDWRKGFQKIDAEGVTRKIRMERISI